ncbi:eukaryotic translation initiation factor 4E1-like isoform X3 [Coccinella septempunctata]|uniref:eukaryotic translation initiation factor 4E1-like isoform X3 n=1 Tax=Coccinella septempunctata TaxID=41139 RepID=UPI001D0793BA|nr:eukaryotic translation initiation factor 4E1-like isoform X3 [Coccinella septempunctata]
MSLAKLKEKNERKELITEEIIPAMDYTLKHPLQNAWTLWYFDSDRSQSWVDNMKEIASFQTVEDFWSLYNHIKPASDIRQGNDYSLFKKGVKPMWEDPANKKGGRWLMNLDRKQRSAELDRYWLDILLCLIGEAFENSDEICGATVNIRGKGDKIGIWTSDASNTQAVLEIGRKIKERLRIPNNTKLVYQLHDDQMAKNSSVTKNAYTL